VIEGPSGSFDFASRDEAARGCAQDDGVKERTAKTNNYKSKNRSRSLRDDKQKSKSEKQILRYAKDDN
jgi:hypothetical protein